MRDDLTTSVPVRARTILGVGVAISTCVGVLASAGCRSGGSAGDFDVRITGGLEDGATVYTSPLFISVEAFEGFDRVWPLEGNARWLIDGNEVASLVLDGYAFDVPPIDTTGLTDGPHEFGVELELVDGRSGRDSRTADLASGLVVQEVRFLVDTTGRWEAIGGDNPELEAHFYGPGGYLGCEALPADGPILLRSGTRVLTPSDARDAGITIVVTDDDDFEPCPEEQSSARSGGIADWDDEIARFGPFSDVDFRAGRSAANEELEVTIAVGRGR